MGRNGFKAGEKEPLDVSAARSPEAQKILEKAGNYGHVERAQELEKENAVSIEKEKPPKKITKKHTVKVHGNVDSRVSPCTNKNIKIRDSYLQRIKDMCPSNGKETLIINEAIRRGLDEIDREVKKGDVNILGD